MNLKPFKNGDRICFIGDSITAMTSWISYIADYYAEKFPKEKIEMYPCGAGGGTCYSALAFYREQALIWNPNAVVIMLGMNDIHRHNYCKNPTDRNLLGQKLTLESYERNLAALTEVIKTQSKVERIIYLAPTPYDEEQVCETENLPGCFKAVRKCAEIAQKTAELYEAEFYDFGGEVYRLLSEAGKIGLTNEIISPDRVHPTEFGMSVMAHIFLAAQGFEDMKINAEDVSNGTAMLSMSDRAKRFDNAAKILQDRWSCEWAMTFVAPDKSLQERKDLAYSYSQRDDVEYKSSAEIYKKHIENEEAYKQELQTAINSLYN